MSNAEEKSNKASTDMLPLLRERSRSLATIRYDLINWVAIFKQKANKKIITSTLIIVGHKKGRKIIFMLVILTIMVAFSGCI